MSDSAPHSLEMRVLVLAPARREAAMIQTVLGKARIDSTICADLGALRDALAAGAGAVLLTEESIDAGNRNRLVEHIERQPPWSDLPLLVLSHRGADSPAAVDEFDELGNVTLLERPIRVGALVSGVRAALRARDRQYQMRSYLAEVQNAAKTRSLLAAIVESSNDAIVSKTLDGIITSWNSGAELLFEYSADEAIGRSILLIIPPDRHDEEQRILRQLRRGLRIQDYETERVTKSGRRIDISVSISPVRDETGRVVGASKVARDIGARKRVEAALKEADRRKDEFLATLAHELRNPLAPIRTSLETLTVARSEQALRRALEIMNRQVDHMVRLVDDLLEVSRITRGKIELRLEVVDLAETIASAVETSRPLIDAASHELIVSGPRPGVLLEADPVRLSQVLANLLNNAAKFTEDRGTIWLTVREAGPVVQISVRDNGIGISPEKLPHVFELFTQAGRSDGRALEGLGIGLSLVQQLVEMHGGTVEARSEGLGSGSEFVVSLPMAERARAAEGEAPPDAASFAQRAEGERRPSGEGDRLSRMTVLVVDDNRDAADSLGALLRTFGATVTVAYDGASALQILHSHGPPDLAFLDIGMPDMNGYDLACQIRERPEYRDVVLIALTGWGRDGDRRRAREAGFDHHVGKPADAAALLALMDSLPPPRPRAVSE